ncbi:MAG: hypothetical protein ACYTXC_23430 [Nostoc sp.]
MKVVILVMKVVMFITKVAMFVTKTFHAELTPKVSQTSFRCVAIVSFKHCGNNLLDILCSRFFYLAKVCSLALPYDYRSSCLGTKQP